MGTIALNVVLQIIESLIFFDFYENIKNSSSKTKNFLIVSVSYMVMCFINIAFNYNTIINLFVFAFSHFCFCKFLYKFKTRFSLLYTALFSCLVIITEQSVLDVISIILHSSPNEIITDNYSYILLIVLSKSTLFLLLKVIATIIKKFQSNEKIRLTILIYPVALILILFDFVVVSKYTNPSNDIRTLLALSSLVLIISIIVTCILQQIESQKEQEILELKALQQKQEINNTYFELLEHQNEELQVFVHDTKKHYRTLYDLAEQPDQLKEYIQGIVTDIEETNQIGKTANKLLDLIISKYDYICSKKQILFEKNIHQSNLGFIGDSDLTSIFNNLFDNAIEAAENSKNKFIFFGLNKVGNMIVIDITNSCDNPPVVKNQKLITTKDDKGLHGYGFKSICRTVKKYNGDIEWEYKKELNEFVVSIIFPIEEHVER